MSGRIFSQIGHQADQRRAEKKARRARRHGHQGPFKVREGEPPVCEFCGGWATVANLCRRNNSTHNERQPF